MALRLIGPTQPTFAIASTFSSRLYSPTRETGVPPTKRFRIRSVRDRTWKMTDWALHCVVVVARLRNRESPKIAGNLATDARDDLRKLRACGQSSHDVCPRDSNRQLAFVSPRPCFRESSANSICVAWPPCCGWDTEREPVGALRRAKMLAQRS